MKYYQKVIKGFIYRKKKYGGKRFRKTGFHYGRGKYAGFFYKDNN